jgi:hypothetical protein
MVFVKVWNQLLSYLDVDSYSFPQPFITPIAKPNVTLTAVNGKPRFVIIVGKNDAATMWLPPLLQKQYY